MIDLSNWGIDRSYIDWKGETKTPDAAVIESIARSMGADETQPPDAQVFVRRPGTKLPFAKCMIHLEQGGEVLAGDRIPDDLPLGYHTIEGKNSTFDLICVPEACYLPDLAAWGCNLQLYSLRSAASWGFGDLGDLRDFALWSKSLGAGAVMINPLCATAPTIPQEPSPYFPSSRLFWNPLYLRMEEIPGASSLGNELGPLISAGKALNQTEIIERDEVFRLKMEALQLIWERTHQTIRLDAFPENDLLERFGTWSVLSERFGASWHQWSNEFRRPGAATREFAANHRERVDFHKWLQLLINEQLKSASVDSMLVFDLPVGVDPNGADAWIWQDQFAPAVTAGAPPDEFNRGGQNWGLRPFDPWKLRSARYGPFIATLKAHLRHAAGLRIDHVMGLSRLYWIPDGFSESEGAYVRYPMDDLFGIVALESVRAGAWIVGEDLGTVESSVREEMRARRMLGQKVFWFEDRDPSEYGRYCMASITTHDLPTALGIWTGDDLREQQSLGLSQDEKSIWPLRNKLVALADGDKISREDVVVRAYEALAKARPMLIMASMEDVTLSTRRPNIPGTHIDRPNWSIPLRLKLEEIKESALARAVAVALSK